MAFWILLRFIYIETLIYELDGFEIPIIMGLGKFRSFGYQSIYIFLEEGASAVYFNFHGLLSLTYNLKYINY